MVARPCGGHVATAGQARGLIEYRGLIESQSHESDLRICGRLGGAESQDMARSEGLEPPTF